SFTLWESCNNEKDNSTDVEEGYPRTVTDFYGTTITLEKKPSRVVCQGIEFPSYLGKSVIDRLIWCSSPSTIETKALVDYYDIGNVCSLKGTMISMTEDIMGKNPDLVLISDSRVNEEQRKTFTQIMNSAGIPVYFYTNQSNLYSNSKECLEVNLLPISEIFGMEDRAKEIIRYVDEKTKELETMLSGQSSTGKNVYIAGGAGKARANFLGSSAATYHPFNYVDKYVHNVMKDILPNTEYTTDVTFETLYQYEAKTAKIDEILISYPAWTDFKNKWGDSTTRAQLNALSAVSSGEVYIITDWFPRAYMGLGCAYYLAEHYYPDLFGSFDTAGFMKDLMKQFYVDDELTNTIYNLMTERMGATGQEPSLFVKVDTSKI
ncbi:ABC transporter substrate-binding protein, partial [Candidatus Methanarcanum hacksteinii]|uniref:ABC transporter substrate-binding protein n=1 Tax=Candidatus Methanarcanum hacksteinii TaxID=2911857 RepID=UPI0037DCDD40